MECGGNLVAYTCPVKKREDIDCVCVLVHGMCGVCVCVHACVCVCMHVCVLLFRRTYVCAVVVFSEQPGMCVFINFLLLSQVKACVWWWADRRCVCCIHTMQP